jgi:hypothetical protein
MASDQEAMREEANLGKPPSFEINWIVVFMALSTDSAGILSANLRSAGPLVARSIERLQGSIQTNIGRHGKTRAV